MISKKLLRQQSLSKIIINFTLQIKSVSMSKESFFEKVFFHCPLSVFSEKIIISQTTKTADYHHILFLFLLI